MGETLNMVAVLPFLTPWLFGVGAAATSVPIIIHLLNKRRFKIVVWAAMDFLLAAQRRNARKLKFQRWLLLILRCVALLLLGAAVGQFVWQNNSLGSMLASGDRAIVVVWDDSYGMGYGEGGGGKASHFEHSKKMLLEWLKGLGAGDRVAVIRASRGAEALVAVPTGDHKNVEEAVAELTVSDAGPDLAGALDKAVEVLKAEPRGTRSKTVVVITDGSNSSIGEGIRVTGTGNSEGAREQLKKAVARVKGEADAALKIVDVGEMEQANKGVVEMRTLRPMVVAGSQAKLEVTVGNATDVAQLDLPVTVLVDGVVVGTEKMARIEPGSVRVMEMGVNLPAVGRHVIEARIPGDLVSADDVRRLVVDVQRELPILVVDGAPGDNQHLGSTTFLQLAFSPVVEGKNPSEFSAKGISEIELPRTPLAGNVAVVLSDVGTLDGKTLGNLKKYVEEGGVLMVFPGDRTTSESMNKTLGALGEGVKLLPAEVGSVVDKGGDEEKGGVKFDPAGYTHPVLAAFGAQERSGTGSGLGTVQTTKYVRLTLPGDKSSETILSFAGGAPAVVAKQVGLGKVILFAMSADNTWTSFPAKPSYLAFLNELLYYSLPREGAIGSGLTMEVGGRVNLAGDAAAAGAWAGPRGLKVNVATVVDDKDKRARLTSGALTRAGVYGPVGGGAVVAVNVDATGVDVRHVKRGQLAAGLGVESGDVIEAGRDGGLQIKASAEQMKDAWGNLGRSLLLCALGVLVVEAFCARLFSTYR